MMNREHRRQLIHASGLIFVILAQVAGGIMIATYLLMLSAFFAVYSFYIKHEQKRMRRIMKHLDELETRLRDFTLGVARHDEIETKFLSGPFWFFLGLGLTFLIFPLYVASAAGAILAVGDSFSNIIGRNFGKRGIIKGRTVEGSVAFFFSAFIAALFFVSPFAALFGALAGALTEIIGRHNDNLTIPVVSAFVMLLVVIM